MIVGRDNETSPAKCTITTYSAKATHRVKVTISISYKDSIPKARQIIEQVIAVSELAVSSVNFLVRGWVETCNSFPVKWYLLETIKTQFDQEGITIPFPQQSIQIQKKKQ